MDRISQPIQIPRRGLAKFSLAAAIVVFMCTSVACSDDTHNAAANATTSSAAHSESPAAATSAEVVVQNLKFTPSSLTIAAGQTVTWRFADGSTAHNVMVDTTTSPTLTTGTWTHQFTQLGTFSYFCPLHPFMKASITVT